jgi:hypothetical protein
MAWSTMWHSQNHSSMAGVWIANGYRLVLVRKVAHDALSKDVERTTKQDVIGWVMNDMNLNVQCDVP